MTTYLSGIQPTGLQHLGNYFGAIREHVRSLEQEGEHFFFIANYHALTTGRDPEALRTRVKETAIAYLALGLDPEKACLFRQSDVPEVTEIAWLLSCVTGMGLLERAHSYKDKVSHGIKPNVGLFTYPILMAADILAYNSTIVPVGKDQVQHVEMAQDMAGHFNHAFGKEVFVRPEYSLAKEAKFAKVVGIDGDKMSKSYENDIWIFETGKKLKKRFGKIKTDSREPSEPKDPAELLPFRFLELFLPEDELRGWEERVRAGGEGAPGYGELKMAAYEAMETTFAAAREKREYFLAHPAELEAILVAGAVKARERARSVRDAALLACGLK
jgi:tryptophanyl-tRNA synthetase